MATQWTRIAFAVYIDAVTVNQADARPYTVEESVAHAHTPVCLDCRSQTYLHVSCCDISFCGRAGIEQTLPKVVARDGILSPEMLLLSCTFSFSLLLLPLLAVKMDRTSRPAHNVAEVGALFGKWDSMQPIYIAATILLAFLLVGRS